MTNQAVIADSITFPDGSSPSGCMLIERVLQQLLTKAFEQLKADPSVVDDLFYKVAAPERASIKSWIAKQNVVVRTGYPEAGYQQPMISIVSESDEEAADQDFLGDMMGLEGEASDGSQGYYTLGYTERSTYNLMCFAGKDGNLVLWLHYLVKAILLLNKPLLIAHGLIDPTVSARDLSFREDMAPEFAFCRVVSVTCRQIFSLYLTEQLATTLVVQTLPMSAIRVSLAQ